MIKKVLVLATCMVFLMAGVAQADISGTTWRLVFLYSCTLW